MQQTAVSPTGRSTGRRIGATILGAIFGLLSGVGFGVLIIQMALISPLSKKGLIVPVAGLLIGALAGYFGGRRRKTAA